MKLLYEQKTEIKVTYPKGVDFPMHVHEAVELVLVLQGSFTGIVGSQHYQVGKGDIFITFPNQVHAYEDSKDFKGYVLIAPGKPFLSAYRAKLEQTLPHSAVFHPEQALYNQLLSLLTLAYQDRQTEYDAVLRGYTLSIVGKLLSSLPFS